MDRDKAVLNRADEANLLGITEHQEMDLLPGHPHILALIYSTEDGTRRADRARSCISH